MTLYADVSLGTWPPKLEDLEPSFAESVGAAFASSLAESPVSSLLDLSATQTARKGLISNPELATAGNLLIALGGEQSDFWTSRLDPETARPAPLEPDEQKRRIADAGLEGAVLPTEGYTRDELDYVLESRREELRRAEIARATPASRLPATFAAGLAASALDPINVASAFFPVVSEARALRLLGSAGGGWGRAGVRAGVGAAEGAVGAAVVEPLVYAGRQSVQADYDMMDSLLNIGFGAALGAALQPATGALGDWMRGRKGKRQPWEYVPSSDVTEKLRSENAARIWAGMRESGAEKLRREHAEAAAALWDATLRGYAYDTGELVGDVYARYRTEWRGGRVEIADMQKGALEQARIKSDALTFEDFADEARENSVPSIFIPRMTPDSVRKKFGIDDLIIEIRDDFIRHLDNDHGKNANTYLAIAMDVLQRAEEINAVTGHKPRKRAAFAPRYSAVIYEEGKGRVVIFELLQSKDKGNRIVPVTAYEGKEELIRDLMARKKPLPMDASIAMDSIGKNPDKVLQVQEAFKKKIEQSGLIDKPLAEENSPRARVTFGEGEAYAVVEFFKAADPSSAPHEMYHIFRRIMADRYDDPKASEASRERYRKACEFVGAEPGKVWTREQEEKFARAGERFLLEDVTPSPRLGDVMESFRQWMAEIYGNAERSGLEISDGMRTVFGKMMGTPEEGALSSSAEWSVGKADSPKRAAGNPLADRFADMPMIEADSSQWFGPGKEMEAEGRNLRKAVQAWARKTFPEGMTVRNADQEWDVRVSPRGIRNSLAHGVDDALAKSVPFIPQIIKSGIRLDSIEKKPGLMSHIFANKIRLDGQDYVVGFVLREDVNGNRFYDHELTEIISPDSLNTDRFPDGSVVHVARANRGEVLNLLRERLGVNDGTGQVLFQSAPAAVVGNPLAARFADMSMIEADSSQWFGPGKVVEGSKENWRTALKQWAKSAFPQGARQKNADTGWDVIVSAKGITKTLSHGYDETLARSVPFVPQIIESGIYVTEGKTEKGMKTHIFANKIHLDGKDYVVGFVLREDQNGRRFYDHELTEIINPDSLNPTSPSEEKARTGTRANRGEVLNLLREKLGVNDGTGQVLFQSAGDPPVREGMTRKPDSATAKVVSLPENAVPEFSGMKEFAAWLKDMLAEGGDVLIRSTGQEARFSRGNVKASVKRSRSGEHRNAYAGLREMVENAEYDHYEAPDERHPDRGGQDVYHSALAMGDKLYSVRLKLDVVTEGEKAQRQIREDVRYKDHKLTEIEIASVQDRGVSEIGKAAHGTDAISEVSLGILRGSVKPSRMEGGRLFQSSRGDVRPDFSGVETAPRARVTFGEGEAYAVVEFFKAADPSSAPHEMYHIFRRIMADRYDDPKASEASRERYRKACEFVGAEPGKVWTREQEEKFARAGERFLLEGVTPSPRLGDVMESFRQWVAEIYGNAERSGLEISDGMRTVFGKMMGTPEEGDRAFRYALGRLVDYSPERGVDTRVDVSEVPPEQTLEEYAREASARLNEAFGALADRPEVQDRFLAELEADRAAADAEVEAARRRGEILRAAAACITRG